MQATFTIETRGPGLTGLTAEIARWTADTGMSDGLLTLLVRHRLAPDPENASAEVPRDLLAPSTALARTVAGWRQPSYRNR